MDDPMIQKRILSLPPEYQEFIMSDFISTASFDLAEAANLGEEDRVILSNALMLFMLFFLDDDDTVNFLVENEFDHNEARTLVNAYLTVLDPAFVDEHADLVASATEDDTEVEEGTNGTGNAPDGPVTQTAVPEQTIPRQVPTPAPAPVAEQPIVNPVRTMADDMQSARNEQTFASSQDAILQTPSANPQATSSQPQ